MITKSIQITTGKLRLQIPTSLAEITIGQMIAMESVTGSEIPLIPGLTQQVVDNIVKYEDLIDIRDRVLSLAHAVKYQYNATLRPEYVTISGRKIKVPKNLSIEPAGAYLACRDLIADEINRHIELYGEDGWKENFVPSLKTCAGILGHYFYCSFTGKIWNEQQAELFANSDIFSISVQEGLPIARFFMNAYPDLSRRKMSLWQIFRQNWRNALALRRIKNSNISRR